MHLATPTPRTKKCITIVSNFSWVLQIEDNTYVTLTFFFLGGGGGGDKVHYGLYENDEYPTCLS